MKALEELAKEHENDLVVIGISLNGVVTATRSLGEEYRMQIEKKTSEPKTQQWVK